MLTKKHFEGMASAIQSGRARHAEGANSTSALLAVARSLADMSAAENPNFDKARFMRACGLEG